jgi:hypothetical protein
LRKAPETLVQLPPPARRASLQASDGGGHVALL